MAPTTAAPTAGFRAAAAYVLSSACTWDRHLQGSLSMRMGSLPGLRLLHAWICLASCTCSVLLHHVQVH